MNASRLFPLLGLFVSLSHWAQDTVVERGPHQTIFETIEKAVVDGEDQEIPHRYTQIASGLNFWSAEENGWVPSSNLIELLDNGAIYRQGQFQLIFAPNINDPNGNLQWFPAPDQRIVLQTIGIVVTEIATGDSIFLAQTKDARGFLTASNEITYVSCFDQIDGDVRIVVNAAGGGLQNDVILHERIPDVSRWGFQGECRLEAWHQILSGPAPELEPGSIRRSDVVTDNDTQLRFGQMRIGEGTAFMVGADRVPIAGEAGKPVPVAKEYFVDPETHMTFLIESIPYQTAFSQLQAMPPGRGSHKLDSKGRDRLFAGRKSGQRHRPVAINEREQHDSGVRAVASIERKQLAERPGLLLDFTSLVTQSNQILSGNVTYVVATNTTVNLSGTTVIEPGCVIKFAGYSGTTPIINILGALDCQTRPFDPCVLTSREDRTVGETNTAQLASIAAIPYGYYHLCFPSSNTNAIQLHDIHSRYAQNAFGFLGTNTVEAWNIQALTVAGDVFEGGGNSVALRNVLVNNANNVVVPTANNTAFAGENLTVHLASKTFYTASTGCTFYLTNAILAVVTNTSSSGLTAVSSQTLTNDSGVFQTVGSGAHYLADGSPYRSQASTNISTRLKGEVFRYSTTYPPIVLTNNITSDTTLTPQAPRDLAAKELGYHYPVIDYAMGGLTLTNSTTLTLTNGVVLAGYDTTALTLNASSKFVSEGTPVAMNRLIRYNTVQEQPTDWGAVGNTIRMLHAGSTVSKVSLRFTEIDYLAYLAASTHNYFLTLSGSAIPTDVTLRDCELYSAYLSLSQSGSGTPVVGITNNLFHRCDFYISDISSSTITVDLRNNLFRYGAVSLVFQGSDGGTWKVHECLFDHVTPSHPYTMPQNSNDGYISSTSLGGSGDTTVSTGDYLTGALGRWYYPTNGGNLSTLINAGSQNITNTGLYHYTVRLDNTKDSGLVDVGYHFVAVDGNGQPIDTDGDGIPDYLEDRNGNGVRDGSESSFSLADTDGDGLSDGIEVSLGLDPNVNQFVVSGANKSLNYDRIDRLNSVSGSATLGVGLDNEGNITSSNP